ncbi:MAG: hypothetical protein ACI8T1_000805 [Verrucomicrobiales bacterium]|jgi:hypothetical protein
MRSRLGIGHEATGRLLVLTGRGIDDHVHVLPFLGLAATGKLVLPVLGAFGCTLGVPRGSNAQT